MIIFATKILMVMKKIIVLLFLLCGFMQASAQTWTDDNGFTWSFSVNGTEATDIKFLGGPDSQKIYLFGGPDNETPAVLGPADAAAGRFSDYEGLYFPFIPDDVYFGNKTLVFDIIAAEEGQFIWGTGVGCTCRVMNGWWSSIYADDVPLSVGLWELPITEAMATECARGGQGKDLDILMTRGSITVKSVYYESSEVSGAVVIPEKVYVGSTELTVTSIGNNAFYGCSGITSVTIPETVTSIGDKAFLGCSGLTGITFPSSVTSIGDNTFRNCTGLTSVTIPSSVESIGSYAFNGCSGLTSVTIEEGVSSIGERAFLWCTGLTSITIPSSVTNIGYIAFHGCTGLTSITVASGNTSYDSRNNCNAIIETATNKLIKGCENTVIPSDVKSIGDYSFYECTGLTNVTIPSSVTSIGSYAFYRCTGLTSLTFPSSLRRIDSYAFCGCSGLTNVTFGEGLTTIGECAFVGCTGLTSMNIGEGVTTIGNYAFAVCYGLTDVTIPSSVTSIGECVFNGCENIQDIYCYAVSCPFVYDNTFYSYSSTLHVPEVSLQQYRDHSVWGLFLEIVPIDESNAINEIGIEGIASEIEAIYDRNGQCQSALRRGVNIIKMSDGTIKKVLVK